MKYQLPKALRKDGQLPPEEAQTGQKMKTPKLWNHIYIHIHTHILTLPPCPSHSLVETEPKTTNSMKAPNSNPF